MNTERPRKRRAVVRGTEGGTSTAPLDRPNVRGTPIRPVTAPPPSSTQTTTRSEFERELDVVRLEVEAVKIKVGTDKYSVRYVPTMRGILGQKGYLLRDKLGKGSYSQVRMAINVPRAQKVAIKIVDKHLAPQDFREKFLPRELHIWPRLRHPNIVRMYHHFEDFRRIYAVLEFAPGGDALRYIQSKGALTNDHSKIWMLQLGDAVRYLHERGIAHRDLKLENLILDAANNIKLCDFGFSKECGINLSSTYCGSKSYAAPEILSGTRYDPKKADIWALGVILFIFATGKMPFDERKGNVGLLEDHISLNFYWPTRVSSKCKETVLSALKFEYSQRPDITRFLNDSWFQIDARRSSSYHSHSHTQTAEATAPTQQANSESRSHSSRLVIMSPDADRD